MAEDSTEKIQGFAWPTPDPNKPAVGDEVVYCEMTLQREENRGSLQERRKEWVTVHRAVIGGPFLFLDSTGLAMIDPATCDFESHRSRVRDWNSIKKKEQDNILSRFGEFHIPGFPPKSGFLGTFAYNYRLIENEITAKTPLEIRGSFQASTDGEKIESKKLSDFARKAFKLTDEIFEISGTFLSSESIKLQIVVPPDESWVQKWVTHPRARLGMAAAAILLVVTCGWTLKETFFSGPQAFARTSASTKPEATQELLGKLHEGCLKGELEACQTLLERRQEFRLNSFYVNFYRQAACKKGAAEFCDSHKDQETE